MLKLMLYLDDVWIFWSPDSSAFFYDSHLFVLHLQLNSHVFIDVLIYELF